MLPHRRRCRRGSLNRNLSSNLAPLHAIDEEEYDCVGDVRKDSADLSPLLRTCRNYCHGKLLHYRLLSNGWELRDPFPTLVVLMYTNCAAFADAHASIVLLPETLQNVYIWNFLFKAFALHAMFHEAFGLFNDMVAHGVLPNKATFRGMLQACTSNSTGCDIYQLHCLTRDFGFDTDPVIGACLANLYSRMGSLRDAESVFNLIVEKDVVSWTSMMLIYSQHGHSELAISIFEQMQLKAVVPDRVSFICAVTSCDKPLALYKGRQINSAIIENGLEVDVTVSTSLVSMYGKCKSLKDARTTFNQMSECNVVSWNALIGGMFHGGMESEALYCFHRMLMEGALPNRETFINFFGACASPDRLTEGMLAHARLLGSEIDPDNMLRNVLINMYGKCSCINHAWKVFERMNSWDVVSWTAMINVYAQHGNCWDACLLFGNMHVKGVKPNEYTFVCVISALHSSAMVVNGRLLHWYVYAKGFESSESIKNALLNMYSRVGSIEDAEWTFERLRSRDVISWTAIIAGFVESGESHKALCFFSKMQQEGKQPNEISFVNIVTACAALTGITEGRLVHGYIVDIGLDSRVDVGNALMNMYGKCGSVNDAQGLFANMQERDRVSWNTLLTVFNQCGNGREAVHLFHSMKDSDTSPDSVTLSIVLSSCSHTGLVSETWELFVAVEHDRVILPVIDHYVCIVDMLGRVGQLIDAIMLINLMPAQPTILAFMTLIGACQLHLEIDVGKYAAKFLLELDPENSASYIVLSNLFALITWEGSLADINSSRIVADV